MPTTASHHDRAELVRSASVAVQRVASVATRGGQVTLAAAQAAVEHPCAGLSKADALVVIAALAARVAALEAGYDRAAQLAYAQIAQIVREAEERRA